MHIFDETDDLTIKPMSQQSELNEILDELESAYKLYYKSHDASAGAARLEAKQQIEALLVEAELKALIAARHEHQFDNFYERIDDRIKHLKAKAKK